jgi:hypothetical protein
MANLVEEFKKMWKNEPFDKSVLVPLLIWASGSEKNIEACQDINKLFFKSDADVLVKQLTLNNKLRNFIKYPKNFKEDEKTEQFYKDLAKYFKWTTTELFKNLDVIDVEGAKEEISLHFAYDTKQRKQIGLKKRKI